MRRSTLRTGTPVAAMSSTSFARPGGFFRYSTIIGSTPLLRIIASVLREVPQAGLWKMVMSVMAPCKLRFLSWQRSFAQRERLCLTGRLGALARKDHREKRDHQQRTAHLSQGAHRGRCAVQTECH